MDLGAIRVRSFSVAGPSGLWPNTELRLSTWPTSFSGKACHVRGRRVELQVSPGNSLNSLKQKPYIVTIKMVIIKIMINSLSGCSRGVRVES